MGAVLQREECDPRLQALEGTAYSDMHGLPRAVRHSMEVAARRKLREAEAEIRDLRVMLKQHQAPEWTRKCFICRKPDWCKHREDELVIVRRSEVREEHANA